AGSPWRWSVAWTRRSSSRTRAGRGCSPTWCAPPRRTCSADRRCSSALPVAHVVDPECGRGHDRPGDRRRQGVVEDDVVRAVGDALGYRADVAAVVVVVDAPRAPLGDEGVPAGLGRDQVELGALAAAGVVEVPARLAAQDLHHVDLAVTGPRLAV